MRLNISILLLFLFYFYSNAYSQISPNIKASLNNIFRYGNGKETFNGKDNAKEYFENIGDARFQVNDIIFGMRYEISDPIEYGSDFKGIRKRFVEYKGSDILNVRAGDFWEVIGRGLTLNTFEQRQLFFDTGIDGVRVIFKKNLGEKHPIKIKSEILGGNIEYRDFLNPNRVESYKVRDFNFEISPFKFLNVGTNYVYATGSIPSGNVVTEIKSYIPELFANINLPNFQIYSSYAHKHTNTNANVLYPFNLSADGDAFYGSVSYTKPGLGITFEYKNYRFDLTTPDNQSTERPTKMLPFQNPPTAVKEHTTTLTSRTPHVVDFNDEVGGQLEIMWSPKDNLFFVLNGSIASRHYSFSDIDTGSRVMFKANDRKYNFIPSLDNAFSPYWEVSIESEYNISDKLFLKSGLYKQYGVLYNDIFPNGSDKKTLLTVPLEMRYTVKKDYTLKFLFENQWANYLLRIPDYQNFTNQFVAISLSKSPDFSFTLSSEFTSDKLEPTGKSNWVEAEVSYNVNSSNVVIASYGSERGGLKCTSGICRYVNPFNGFRLTIQSKF
ncbi:MAG: hypothetical protein HY959_11345 [Ignavibacteriae bacterium]|nr:hypothetical protein [Ignavibacteriota bacterium]